MFSRRALVATVLLTALAVVVVLVDPIAHWLVLFLYPVVADPGRRLGAMLGLPTFEFDGATLYKRVTLVLEHGRVAKVFYPVFPPDRNAEEVLAWLAS